MILSSASVLAADKVDQILMEAAMDFADKKYEQVNTAMAKMAEDMELTNTQRFNARFMLAFSFYHIKLESAEQVFSELAIEVEKLTPEERELVNDFINDTYEMVWIDIFRKIHKYNDAVLDKLAKTFRDRATVYHAVATLKPVIRITDDMYLFVDQRPDNEEYRRMYGEIQELQKDIAEKEGLGAGAKK